MNRKTSELVQSIPYTDMDVLEISGGKKWKEWSFKSYEVKSYPDFDICELNNPKPEFDLIIAEQVLEHLLKPYQAARNIFGLLKPGGYFLITVPFLIPIHEVPYDCTRWTPKGLKYFLHETGFSLGNIKVDSWGNKDCVIASLDSWQEYQEDIHSLDNHHKYPVQVWALSKKG